MVCELNVNTGGPPDMRILGLVKIRISGKSHSENQKVVITFAAENARNLLNECIHCHH